MVPTDNITSIKGSSAHLSCLSPKGDKEVSALLCFVFFLSPTTYHFYQSLKGKKKMQFVSSYQTFPVYCFDVFKFIFIFIDSKL